MPTLQKLFKKKNKIIVGLMSGTSADGIDAVLVEISGSATRTRIRQRAFATIPYPRGYSDFLFRNSAAATACLDEITRLNVLIGEFFADAARQVAQMAGVRLTKIDLIGSHGQTICHLPEAVRLFGKEIRATLQIGDPALIAKRTGIVTVGNFRAADVAVGGSGAPLVPYVDYVLFRSKTKNRALLNIGGIANITVLPRNCSLGDVVAFDTGPGNMAIDGLMKRIYGRRFDRDGKTALEGNLRPHLLRWMTQHRYLRRNPPKSTGREVFGDKFVEEILERSKEEKVEDIITTVSEFVALSVYDAYLRFIRPELILDELFVSGGGSHNMYLMDALRRYFGNTEVKVLEELGYSSDAKEAICFAILANETIAGHAANVLGATGADRETVLGMICLP